MAQVQNAQPTEQTSIRPKTRPKDETQPRKLPPYNVVLLDDNDHTYEYVVEMMQKLFGHSLSRAFRIALEVDTTGRVVVLTTTKEHAELKRDQILGFGPDRWLARCKGAMTAIIEPAEGGDDDKSDE